MAAPGEKSLSNEDYQQLASDDSSSESHRGREEDVPLLGVPVEPVTRQYDRFWVLPEVATFLYFLAVVTQAPVQQFWLVDHFSKEYKLQQENDTNYCDNISQSGSYIENEVQSQTNKYVMYGGFICNFSAILPTLFLGSLTDRYGRKIVFFVSFLGLLGNLLLNTMIIHFNLTPDLLYVSGFILGLSGSYGLYLAAAFGVIADITSAGKQRAFRVATLEAVIAISSSVGTITSGIWVNELGYLWPMVFSLGLVIVAILFTLFFIPETLVERQSHSFSAKAFMKCFEFYVRDTSNKRRFKLICCIICFLIYVACVTGDFNFGILYLLHQPFCWPKDQITVFNGSLTLIRWLVLMLFIQMGKRWISEPIFALLGSISGASVYLLKGLAGSNLLIFMGSGTGLISDLVSPMCRTMMSKFVSHREQGALFAGIGVLQMVVTAVAGIVMSNIYNLGLDFYLGLPYLVLTGLFCVNAIIFVVLFVYIKRHPELSQPFVQEERIIVS